MAEKYFNTTRLTGDKLAAEKKNAESQGQKLLVYFRVYKAMTASEAYRHFPKSIPLTSIRRALTNLATDGLVEKTEQQKPGMYGKPEYIYRIKPSQKVEQQLNLFK